MSKFNFKSLSVCLSVCLWVCAHNIEGLSKHPMYGFINILMSAARLNSIFTSFHQSRFCPCTPLERSQRSKTFAKFTPPTIISIYMHIQMLLHRWSAGYILYEYSSYFFDVTTAQVCLGVYTHISPGHRCTTRHTQWWWGPTTGRLKWLSVICLVCSVHSLFSCTCTHTCVYTCICM